MILVGNGYVAKTVCSGVFVSGRKPHAVRAAEIQSNDPGILRLVAVDVDRSALTVTARFLGLGERVAVFRGPLGCTLALNVSSRELASRALPAVAAPLSSRPWPSGQALSRLAASGPGIDRAALGALLDEAFAEPGAIPTRRTRAVVVVHDGEIVAERYAAGYGRESVLAGWSMTKSAVNALVGVLVRDGKLALDAPLDVPEWSAPDDARRAITLRQLLHMSSGLRFSESYGNPLGDVLWMLFGTGDAARFAAGKRLVAPPGRQWYYSSGTTNIIARALRRAVGGTEADYLTFPRRALFEPLGMSGGVIEPDAAGAFVGSSFMFASARDWARPSGVAARLRDDGGDARVTADGVERGDVLGQAPVELRELHPRPEREAVDELAERLRRSAVGVLDEGHERCDPRIELRGEHARVVRPDLDELLLDRRQRPHERPRGFLDRR